MVEDVHLFKIVIEKADVAKYSVFKSSSVKLRHRRWQTFYVIEISPTATSPSLGE